MTKKPNVKPGDWISFGNGPFPMNAVVCSVYHDNALADIEVVYLDERGRAINEDMVWKDGVWKFKDSGAGGGYADRYEHLKNYVMQLRRGCY
jgi:hypothetical protein